MKIVQFIPSLHSGGAERFVTDLCNQLSSKHEIYLFTLYDLKEYDFYLNEINEKVEVISFDKKLGVNLFTPFKVYFKLRKIKPDIIHSHLSAIFYMIFSVFLLRGVSFFHTIHNEANKEAKTKFDFKFKQFLFKYNLVIPINISDSSQKSFTKLYKLKSKLIYNGRLLNLSKVNINDYIFNEYKISKDTKIFVNIARLNIQKNQVMLAKVFKRLKEFGYDVRLIIIGNDDNKDIKRKILAANSEVKILGQLSNPLDYVANADAFCLSSFHEGMPISLIECFAVGAIPICTPVGGINDMIIDGQNGFLSADNGLDSYLSKVEMFLNLNKRQIRNLKEESKKSFEKYTMENCALQHEDLYLNRL